MDKLEFEALRDEASEFVGDTVIMRVPPRYVPEKYLFMTIKSYEYQERFSPSAVLRSSTGLIIEVQLKKVVQEFKKIYESGNHL